ncbi:MAG: transcription-repair coupling factor [Ruminococcaceae bacterium]|nr:transcription-repair coupling factor [Oscillospiraceae bacterium]
MKNDILLQVMRESREYRALSEGLMLSRRRAKQRPSAVTGLSEGASPIFLTALAADEAGEGRRVLILFANEKDASEEAVRLNSEGIKAYHLPARDYNFNNTTASREYEHARLCVLSECLFSDSPFVVCATAEAALQVTVPPEELIHLTYNIKQDCPLDLDRFVEVLTHGGYRRVELCEGAGQFAVRGGIVDVYPPAEAPYRIELFGDEIDRIGTFDPQSQRFVDFIDTDLRIPPSREIVLTPERRELIFAAADKQIKKLAKSDDADLRTIELLMQEQAEIKESADVGFLDKYIPLVYPEGDCFFDYFDGLMVISDTTAVKDRANAAEELLSQSVLDMLKAGEIYSKVTGTYVNGFSRVEVAAGVLPTVLLDPFAKNHPGMVPEARYDFATRHIPPYASNTTLLMEDLSKFVDGGYRCALLCANEAEAKNISKMLTDEGYSAAPWDGREGFFGEKKKKYPVAVLFGDSFPGFELIGARFALLDYSGVSGGTQRVLSRRKGAKYKKKTQSILSYSDLEPGDYVVHEAYGIGQYLGIETLTVDGISRDYVKITYQGTDKLFLPVDQLDLVSKYIGAGADGAVKLSKMGGSDWTRAKSKASASAKEMAKELIELYARRRRAKGIAYPPDDDMSRQFASAFEYDETESQLSAIDDINRDMEAGFPMERIVCGDVGYGKTEVALRAAFKAVNGGKQVAILVPTTILAYQHFQTALSRFRGFPVSIDMLSRFRTKAQQEESLRKLRRGETDIIIGTHRIISKDIEFCDLGLVIIDEEQRFGVAQKEKLKEIAIGADMLTLTATPIPRTLNMAMGGIMDMSLLDDVPGLRSPVQTYVMEHDDGIIAEAIRRELRRGGQVFYLNNNIEYLYTLQTKLNQMLPDARIAVAHGRMDREDLEEIWAGLVRGEVDVLVCTTIIETGVDVSNANTLIIENADRFGLSQLHQIRGRVGRSSRRAYAYFTYPKMKQLTEIADKRLRAMKEYAAFGAGFKIALRDLEIRGAGNLLGSQQHGHMEAVGYDMYIKLLEEAVLEEKGETKKPREDCSVNVRADAYLPKGYIKDGAQRMEMYRKIARIQREDDFSDMLDELCDRFGEPPRAAMNLCRIALVRGLGITAGMKKIEERERELVLTAPAPDLSAVRKLAEKHPGAIRMTLGQMPAITVKKPKGAQVADFLSDLLTEYIQLTLENE